MNNMGKLFIFCCFVVIINTIVSSASVVVPFTTKNNLEIIDNKLQISSKITPSDSSNNPNVNIIERLIDDGKDNNSTIVDSGKLEQTIRYVLGHHSSVDKLIAQSANNYHYNSLQNIVLKLCYPTSGIGSIVTYVEIVIDQLSNIGRAYVISGGIGKRQICVAIEASRTNFVSYRASFYGY